MPTSAPAVEVRPITGFDGYFADRDGRIWSYRTRTRFQLEATWKQLHENVIHGYSYVTLCGNNSRVNKRVHRLVLEAFIGPCPDGMHGCHKDGIRSNNAVSNLRWGTPESNQRDKRLHGTSRGGRGEKNRAAKLTAKQVSEIRAAYEVRPEPIAVIARRYGVSTCPIRMLLTGRTWKD